MPSFSQSPPFCVTCLRDGDTESKATKYPDLTIRETVERRIGSMGSKITITYLHGLHDALHCDFMKSEV